MDNDDVVHVVVAGNYRQFIQWCRDAKMNPRSPNVIYATDRIWERLHGVTEVKLHYIGMWFNRNSNELAEIEQAVRVIRGGHDVRNAGSGSAS